MWGPTIRQAPASQPFNQKEKTMNRQLDREMDALTSSMNAELQRDFPDARLAHQHTSPADTVTARIDSTIAFLESQIEALLAIRRRL
jgi:small-conductance mechanosensitive channel